MFKIYNPFYRRMCPLGLKTDLKYECYSVTLLDGKETKLVSGINQDKVRWIYLTRSTKSIQSDGLLSHGRAVER